MRKEEFPIVDKLVQDRINEVLDKIREEIEVLDIFYDNDYFSGNRDAMFKCNDVLQIIDKYKEDT